ncbi:hypothetical protein BV25DRAFT_1835422 [Artomyces pyxidatus]|uniref:Uncharacterized protein n=1 Tax=Artomyces pyxidatus TaxID=48021 RepID=A0ACB8TF99_9AGAM|nr:hypothetical protein BV25DRAFT_1835422 [Artomyces pyxidatus]
MQIGTVLALWRTAGNGPTRPGSLEGASRCGRVTVPAIYIFLELQFRFRAGTVTVFALPPLTSLCVNVYEESSLAFPFALFQHVLAVRTFAEFHTTTNDSIWGSLAGVRTQQTIYCQVPGYIQRRVRCDRGMLFSFLASTTPVTAPIQIYFRTPRRRFTLTLSRREGPQSRDNARKSGSVLNAASQLEDRGVDQRELPFSIIVLGNKVEGRKPKACEVDFPSGPFNVIGPHQKALRGFGRTLDTENTPNYGRPFPPQDWQQYCLGPCFKYEKAFPSYGAVMDILCCSSRDRLRGKLERTWTAAANSGQNYTWLRTGAVSFLIDRPTLMHFTQVIRQVHHPTARVVVTSLHSISQFSSAASFLTTSVSRLSHFFLPTYIPSFNSTTGTIRMLPVSTSSRSAAISYSSNAVEPLGRPSPSEVIHEYSYSERRGSDGVQFSAYSPGPSPIEISRSPRPDRRGHVSARGRSVHGSRSGEAPWDFRESLFPIPPIRLQLTHEVDEANRLPPLSSWFPDNVDLIPPLAARISVGIRDAKATPKMTKFDMSQRRPMPESVPSQSRPVKPSVRLDRDKSTPDQVTFRLRPNRSQLVAAYMNKSRVHPVLLGSFISDATSEFNKGQSTFRSLNGEQISTREFDLFGPDGNKISEDNVSYTERSSISSDTLETPANSPPTVEELVTFPKPQPPYPRSCHLPLVSTSKHSMHVRWMNMMLRLSEIDEYCYAVETTRSIKKGRAVLTAAARNALVWGPLGHRNSVMPAGDVWVQSTPPGRVSISLGNGNWMDWAGNAQAEGVSHPLLPERRLWFAYDTGFSWVVKSGLKSRRTGWKGAIRDYMMLPEFGDGRGHPRQATVEDVVTIMARSGSRKNQLGNTAVACLPCNEATFGVFVPGHGGER